MTQCHCLTPLPTPLFKPEARNVFAYEEQIVNNEDLEAALDFRLDLVLPDCDLG